MRKAWIISVVLAGTVGLNSPSALLGDLPLVNMQQGTSNISLNLENAGTHQQLGLFLINSNDPLGFHVTFTFANRGNFQAGARQIPITNLVLNKISGTLGTSPTDPVNVPITLDGSGSWTWSPGVPTVETENLLVEIAGDWAGESGRIAGFYRESITCVVASGP